MRSPPDLFISYQNPSCPAASSSRSFTQIGQKFSSIFNAKPTGPYRPLSFSMVHLIPKPFLPNPTVCPIRSLTQIDHECSGIFNAKPTGADQPLRFKRYLLPPLHPKEASPKSDTNVRAASMPRSPDQLGHSSFSKPTGPYRTYTDRSSFSIPTAPPFKGHYGRNSPQGTDQEKFVSDNHVHTPLCNRCAHNGPTSEPDR